MITSKLRLAIFLFTCFIGFLPHAFAQGGRNRMRPIVEDVRFYSRDNFRGESVPQGVGDIRSVNWTINSVQVPAGYVVEAYAQENFRGQSVRLVGNVPQVGKIRSLRISRELANNRPDYSEGRGPGRRPDRPDRNGMNTVIVLYSDIDYQGPSITLSEGRYRAAALGTLFRQASSIQIPVGYKVQVFARDNFSGNSSTFANSVNDLRNFSLNDQVASVIISRGR